MSSPTFLRRLTALFFLALLGCLHAEGLKVADLERDTDINFNREIYPVFKRNCLACHNDSKAKAKLVLETPEAIRKGSADGPVVVPGKAEESLLFTSSAHLIEDIMPPKDNKSKALNLTPRELALLKLWIDQGAKGSGAVLAEAPKKWVRYGKKQPLYALAVSPDGRYAACGRGHHIDLYDLKLKKHLARLADPALKSASHLDLVRSLAFDQDGMIASGGYRVIKLWEPSSMDPTLVPAEETRTDAAAVSTDGSWSLSLNKERNQLTKLVHEGNQSSALPLPEKVTGIAILHDQKTIAVAFESGKIRVLQPGIFERKAPPKPAASKPEPAPPVPEATKKEEKAPAGPAPAKPAAPKPSPPPPAANGVELYFDLAAHGAGAVMLLSDAKQPLVSADASGKIILWDLEQKKPRSTFNHGAGLAHVAMHSGVGRLVSTSEKGKALLWDLNTPSKHLASLALGPAAKAEIDRLTLDRTVATQTVSRSDTLIKQTEEAVTNELESAESVAAEYLVKKLELKTAEAAHRVLARDRALEEKLKELGGTGEKAKDEDAAKKEEAFDAAGEELETLESKVASLENGKARSLEMYSKAARKLAQAKIEKTSAESLLKSLDEQLAERNEFLSKTVPGYPIAETALSGDGSILAVAFTAGTIHLYESATGGFLESIHTGKPITEILFRDGDSLVSVNGDGQQLSWPTQRKWAYARRIGDGKDGTVLVDRVTALGFGPDSSLVSASGVPSRSGQLKVWDTHTLELKAEDPEAHKDLISTIRFSPERNRFVTASSDGLAKVYEIDPLEQSESLEGHGLAVLDVSWSGDGRLIATAGADGQIILWDTQSGEKHKTIKGKGNEITIVEFLSKASEGLLTAEGAGSLKANNRDLPGEFEYAYAASLTPDGSMILAGGLSGELKLWDAAKYSLLKTFEPSP